MESDAVIKELFNHFTKRGFVLYQFLMIQSYGAPTRKPVVVDGVTMINEPVVVKIAHGWESQYKLNYEEFGLGTIQEMKPLKTLDEIIEAGPEYLREFLGVMVDQLVNTKFSKK